MHDKHYLKYLIKRTVSENIINFSKKSIYDSSSEHILELFMPKERTIAKSIKNLEKSFNKIVLEPIAKTLAEHNGFETINSYLEYPTNIAQEAKEEIAKIIEERINNSGKFDGATSHLEIRKICTQYPIYRIATSWEKVKWRENPLWIRKNNTNYFFDIVDCRPNSKKLMEYTEQLMRWYVSFYFSHPNQIASAKIIFPSNPYGITTASFWRNQKNYGKPLDSNHEAWVEKKFWDFCSGVDNTFSLITDCLIELKNNKEFKDLFYSSFIER